MPAIKRAKGENKMIDQKALLKAMAIKFYECDGGTMHECFGDADYQYWIDQEGTAEKAWLAHLENYGAQQEVFGYHEAY